MRISRTIAISLSPLPPCVYATGRVPHTLQVMMTSDLLGVTSVDPSLSPSIPQQPDTPPTIIPSPSSVSNEPATPPISAKVVPSSSISSSSENDIPQTNINDTINGDNNIVSATDPSSTSETSPSSPTLSSSSHSRSASLRSSSLTATTNVTSIPTSSASMKSSSPAASLQDLRSLGDYYAILHFIELFNITSTLSIQGFTIDKLENSLLDCGPYLIDIIIKLLKCISRKPINYDTWEKALQSLIKNRIGEIDSENSLDTSSFHELPIKDRVRILLSLCEWQLDDNLALQPLLNDNKMVPKLQGLEPIGRDKKDNTYYYFDMGGSIRFCRQTLITPIPTTTKGKRSRNDLYDNPDAASWETVAATLPEFEDFLSTIVSSKNKDEVSLRKLVENTYIPALHAKEKSQQIAQKRMQRLDVSTNNIISSGRARKSIKYSSFFEDHDDEL